MRKESTESRSESRPEWEQLEDWVRSQVQRLIQELLEEEVTAFWEGRSRRSDPTRTKIPLSERIRQSPEAYPESTEGGRRVSVLRRQEGAPVLLG